MIEIPDRKLNDGNSIPAVGFGCFPWGGADSETMVRSALDAGYRLLDTALNYRNEEEVGRVVARSGLPREEVLVTAKLPCRYHGYDETSTAFRESLANLRFDYVDLYLIHWPLPRLNKYVDSWRAMTLENLDIFGFTLTDAELDAISGLTTGQRLWDQDPDVHEEF